MTRSHTNDQRSTYEPSGRELRVYWDERAETYDDMDGTTRSGWSYAEAVLPISATEAEIAAGVRAVDADADAEALAAGWFASGIPDSIPLRFRTLAIAAQHQALGEDIATALGYRGGWHHADDAAGHRRYIITAGWMPPEMVWSDPVVLWRQATDAGFSCEAKDVVAMLAGGDCSDDDPLMVRRRLRLA